MPEITSSRYLVQAGWRDVPHLDADTQRELLASTQPYLRDARSKGIPSLGAGAIYPVEESAITVEPFAIPAYWRRAYGLDVGWNRTAAVWGAHDPNTDTVYLYAEHYRGQAEPRCMPPPSGPGASGCRASSIPPRAAGPSATASS